MMKAPHLCRISVIVVAAALFGCGGSKDEKKQSGTTVSGTAAMGAAIANATVTITGATGGEVTASSSADGKYSADVATLTAPYLLKVTTGGTTLYSVGAVAGTVNLHPLTDLIVRSWYEVLGVTADAAFANPTANPPPNATEVAVIATVVEKIVSQWLSANGVDPAVFDPITSAFDANGVGFDAVLDTLTVDLTNPAAPIVHVDAGASGTQTSNVTVGSNGAMSISTQVTVDGVTSTSFTSAVVPAGDAAGAALEGVLTTLASMAEVVNNKGASLTGADIAPFVDTTLLDGGKDATAFAQRMAHDLAGNHLDSFVVHHIISFNADTGVIAIVGEATMTVNGQTVTQVADGDGHEGMIFRRQSNGAYKFYGDQRRAKFNLQTEVSRRASGQTCQIGCDGVYYDLQVQISAAVGEVSSATVTGSIGGSVQTLPLTKGSSTFYDDAGLPTDHWDLDGGVGGTFYGLASPSEFPVAGSSYTVHLVFADATTAEYTSILGASTSESIDLAAGVEASVGHSASSSAGHPVTLTWRLPHTYPIHDVSMYASVTNIDNEHCDVQGPDLAPTSTTATMTLPATCNGKALQIDPGFPSISINVDGESGERTGIWYAFR